MYTGSLFASTLAATCRWQAADRRSLKMPTVAIDDLEVKRRAGQIDMADIDVFDFTVAITRVKWKKPSESTLRAMMQTMLRPNSSKNAIREKAQLALNLFFSWPEATAMIQKRLIDSYQDRKRENRRANQASYDRKHGTSAKKKTEAERRNRTKKVLKIMEESM